MFFKEEPFAYESHDAYALIVRIDGASVLNNDAVQKHYDRVVCNSQTDEESNLLGCLVMSQLDSLSPLETRRYGSLLFCLDNNNDLDKKALTFSLINLMEYAIDYGLDVGIPYKLGCPSMSDSDWETCILVIRRVFCRHKKVTIYTPCSTINI